MEQLISEKNVNCGRQFEFDCVKFFAILYMVCIHIYENLSNVVDYSTYPDTVLRIAVEFLGGPLAAPVFMFAMGVGMIYTRHSEWIDFVKRGIKLLILGYVLSFFKMPFYMILGKFIGLEYDSAKFTFLDSMLVVDILQFAGMAFIVIGLMKRFKLSSLTMLVISVVIQAAGIWATKLELFNSLTGLLLGLILPTHVMSAFPLTLWLIYPVAGMCFAELLRKVTDKKRFYQRTLLIGLLGFVSLSSGLMWYGFDLRSFFALKDEIYYFQSFPTSIWTLCVVITAISICWLLFSKLENTKVGTLFKFFSTNLNTIYIIQWIIITFFLYISTETEFKIVFSQEALIPAALALVIISALITVPIVQIKKSRRKNREAKQN